MKKKISMVFQGFAILSALLLVANGLLGYALVSQSKSSMQTLIRGRMLDISNTAAAMLDGDALEKLTKDDSETEPYLAVLRALTYFQDNIDLEYIYTIRKVGEGKFVFTCDPTVLDPGEFGAPVKTTEALERASAGVATVDETPYEDSWGRFYSAYSPVFDSAGEVAGVVAVDFDASWFDDQISRMNRYIFIACAMSLLVGAMIVLLLTGRLRKRFRALNGMMHELSGDVEDLAKEVKVPLSHGYPARMTSRDEERDDIGELGEKIRATRRELRAYVDYVHSQAFTDPMTGVGNKTAYMDKLKRLNSQISTNMAEFFVVVFDMNGLKQINDNLGHEFGDQALCDAAAILRDVFGPERVYRIGGDEFIAVLEHVDQGEVDRLFAEMDSALEAFNRVRRSYDVPLTISRGAAAYIRGKDRQYQSIFRRADEAMYRDKAAHYERVGGKRE